MQTLWRSLRETKSRAKSPSLKRLCGLCGQIIVLPVDDSGLRFQTPAVSILLGPQFHSICVVDDMAVVGIGVQGASDTMSDISQMAKQRTLMSRFDVRVRAITVPNTI